MAESATTEQDVVKISGRGALVNIQIDDCVPVEVACRTLRERLGRGRHLYSHGEVIVDIGQRILSNDGPERIRNVIESESGLTIKQFWCEPSVLEREHQRIDSLMDLNSRTHDRVYGNGPGEGGCTLHNPHYDFSDDVLPIGASYWAKLTESVLAK